LAIDFDVTLSGGKKKKRKEVPPMVFALLDSLDEGTSAPQATTTRKQERSVTRAMLVWKALLANSSQNSRSCSCNSTLTRFPPLFASATMDRIERHHRQNGTCSHPQGHGLALPLLACSLLVSFFLFSLLSLFYLPFLSSISPFSIFSLFSLLFSVQPLFLIWAVGKTPPQG